MTVENPAGQPDMPGGFRPYAGVLAECRDLFERRVVQILAGAIPAVDEQLQARRREMGAVEESLRLLEAQYQLRALAEGLSQRFRTSFSTQFRRRTSTAPAKATVYGDDNLFLPELSLVDQAQISEELSLQNLANRLQGICEPELQYLLPRMAFLLDQEDIEPAANPLGPAAISEALKDICRTIEGSEETRSLLLDLLAARLGSELTDAYRELNELLIARKIMPRVRPKLRRRGAEGRGTQRGGTGAVNSPAAPDILNQLFSPREGSASAHDALPQDWRTSSGGIELMQALTRLQMGETGVSLGGDAFALDPGAAATTNVLNALLDAGLGRHLGSVDGIVIDVVATLFDYIFDDDRVPGSMKGLIGRLQIPVLKLAMMDHSFFSNRGHAARRLINALAQSASTWDGELTPESSLYRTAEAIVLRIQNEFSENPDVFVACHAEFEEYLAEQERNADKRAAALTGKLEQRERLELARTVATNAIGTHLADEDLPESVRAFVGDVWLKVLTRAVLADGEDGERWREAIATLDELVWSVQPKKGGDARQQLVQRLPTLLKGLRAGIDGVQIEDAIRDRFFTDLVKLHAAAVKAGMNAPGGGSEAAAASTDGRATPRAPRPAPAEPAAAEEPETLELEMLRRGDWIELKDESGEKRRFRLTWISPARTMYLFANRQGRRALALTRSELTRRFGCGEAITSNDEPLIDRIVDNVLDTYQS